MLKNILLVKLRGIGDAVLLTPSIRSIKESIPDSFITVVTSPSGAQILEKNQDINEIIVYDKNKLFKICMDITKIRRRKIDLAINFHASMRSALLTCFSGAKFRVVHNHSGKDYFSNINITARKEQKSIIERDFDCLRAIGINPDSKETKIYLTDSEKESGNKFLQNLLPQLKIDFDNIKFVGINPGAARATKRWAEEKFALLSDKIIEKHNSKILIFTGPGEEYIGEKIIKLMSNKAYLVKDLSLREVASIINYCSLLIGNDNGLFHMAVALGVPTITIFGPENPVEWHPYNHLPVGKHIVISKNLPCMNCGKISCESDECIDLITVSEVFDLISLTSQIK